LQASLLYCSESNLHFTSLNGSLWFWVFVCPINPLNSIKFRLILV
jgi:hypothetical protein